MPGPAAGPVPVARAAESAGATPRGRTRCILEKVHGMHHN